MNPRVKMVEYLEPYKLVITFNNNEIKVFDMASYLKYPVYKPLQDPGFCKQVKASLGTVVWNDSIDFDPDTLYIESYPFLEKTRT